MRVRTHVAPPISPPSSGAARQLARKQGRARISAVTAGIGLASVLGTLAIAFTLPAPMSGMSTKGVIAATVTSQGSADTKLVDFSSQPQKPKDHGSMKHGTTQGQPAVTSGRP